MEKARKNRTKVNVRRVTYAALCLAIALVLPFITGQIPQIGAMLCPMHIPVLLCGFICGWPLGLVVGFIAPLLRGALFGMPALFPTGVAMAFELAVYGAVSGLAYKLLPKRKAFIYLSLIIAMVCGRVVWGIVQLTIAGLSGNEFTWAAYLAGAVTDAIPGIIIQIILIPILVMAMEKTDLTLK